MVLGNKILPDRAGLYFLRPMETLFRTILILLASFAAGQILPPDAMFLPLCFMAASVMAIIDFFLMLTTGKGLLYHIKNS